MYNMRAGIKYQSVDEYCKFHVTKLESHDMIPGTLFLHQHSMRLSFSPNSVYMRSDDVLPVEGSNILTISSLSEDVLESQMEDLRQKLRKEAADLCRSMSKTLLPPFCMIKHTIPLINDNLVSNFQPLHCPEALKPQFKAKACEYLKTCWRLVTGTNAIPMLSLPKKTNDKSVQLQMVFNK